MIWAVRVYGDGTTDPYTHGRYFTRSKALRVARELNDDPRYNGSYASVNWTNT